MLYAKHAGDIKPVLIAVCSVPGPLSRGALRPAAVVAAIDSRIGRPLPVRADKRRPDCALHRRLRCGPSGRERQLSAPSEWCHGDVTGVACPVPPSAHDPHLGGPLHGDRTVWAAASSPHRKRCRQAASLPPAVSLPNALLSLFCRALVRFHPISSFLRGG